MQIIIGIVFVVVMISLLVAICLYLLEDIFSRKSKKDLIREQIELMELEDRLQQMHETRELLRKKRENMKLI